METFIGILEALPELIEAILALFGSLAVMSRYTPWKWDDKVFGAVEKPVNLMKEKAKELKKR
jgi:hypothetical protein